MLEDKCDYFILAYNSSSFSAAAASVPMTPQGFTRIIRNLERDLGVPLFETDEHGKRTPTAFADEYYRYAEAVQKARQQLKVGLERIKNDEMVDLKVACSIGIRGLFGAEAIGGETYNHPQVNIIQTEIPDIQCDALVESGSYDLGVTVDPPSSGLASIKLVSSPLLILVNKADPLSQKSELTMEDLSDRKLAMPGKEFHIYNNLIAEYEKKGIPLPVIVEYTEVFWIYEFVAENKGFGFSLPHLASLDLFSSSDDVVAVPLAGIAWTVVLTYQKTRDLSTPMRNYISEMKKVAKRLKVKHRASSAER